MYSFVSCCLLGYKRPDQLIQCLDSLHATIDYPCEIIVSIDGEDNPDQHAVSIAYQYLRDKKISKLIAVGGLNRGVGRSFQNCLGVAEGDYIFKIDTDLTFKPHWLSTAIHALENNLDVGAISLFNYNNYDPTDKRFEILEDRSDIYLVSDFVSSIYGIRRSSLSPFIFLDTVIPDDGMHQQFGKMAITKTDFVINSGFGLGKSTYVSPDALGNPVKTRTYSEPLLFPILT